MADDNKRYILRDKRTNKYFKKGEVSYYNKWVDDVIDATLYKQPKYLEYYGMTTRYFDKEGNRLDIEAVKKIGWSKCRMNREFRPEYFEIIEVTIDISL